MASVSALSASYPFRWEPLAPRTIQPPPPVPTPFPAQDPAYAAPCPFCQRPRFGVSYSFVNPLAALPASPLLTCAGRAARARGSSTSTAISNAIVTASVRDREELQREIIREAALPPPAAEPTHRARHDRRSTSLSQAHVGSTRTTTSTSPSQAAPSSLRAAVALGPSAVAWRAAGRGAAAAPQRASYARVHASRGRGDDEEDDEDEESDSSNAGPSTGSQWRLRALAEAGSRGRAAAAVADNAALEDAMLQHALRESLMEVNSTPQRQSSAVAAPCALAAASEHDALSREHLLLPSYTAEPLLEFLGDDDDADALAAAIALSMVLNQEPQPREPAVGAGTAACRISAGVPGRLHAHEIAPALCLRGSALAASAETAPDDTSAAELHQVEGGGREFSAVAAGTVEDGTAFGGLGIRNAIPSTASAPPCSLPQAPSAELPLLITAIAAASTR